MPLIVLLACVDPEDCRFFEDGCDWYLTEGLHCGLASVRSDHAGGSCDACWDPALTTNSSGVLETARREDAACPEGFVQHGVSDRDGGNWGTCMANGNLEASSGDLQDVPAGAACGLGRVASSGQEPCAGHVPSETGTCPDGYAFAWVVDAFGGGACDGGSDLRVLAFCEAAAGCETCPARSLELGLLCGLHARDETGALRDMEEALAWFEACGELEPALREAMQQSVDRSPTCMGQDVSEGSCPQGLALVCTDDWVGGAPQEQALCWCGPEASQQELDDGWSDPGTCEGAQ